MTGQLPQRLHRTLTGPTRRVAPSTRPDLRRSLVFFAAALLTVLVLLTLDARHDDSATALDPARRAVAAALGPVQNQVASARSAFVGYSRAFVDPAHASAQVRRLEAENARLTADAARQRDRAHTSAQLDRIDRLADGAHLKVAAARVLAIGPGQGFEHTVTVSAGRADGVRHQSAVLAAGGLVGRVVGVGSHTSTVLLLCDARSAVGVRVGDAGQVAIARGTGDCAAALHVTELALGSHPKVGEPVTTWGSAWSTPYPPGLPVGTISRVGTDQLALTPAAFTRSAGALDVVGVVVAR